MEPDQIKKLYYSISEVSQITGLKQYVLRYWETEFSQLKPSKNRAGNRTYKIQDVDLIVKIKTLLYERKFTIKGAKQFLNKSSQDNIEANKPSTKIIKLTESNDFKDLKKVRDSLHQLNKIIEQYKD